MQRNFDFHQVQIAINEKNFDEYPACDLCGSEVTEEKFTSRGARIVSCTNCGLWFTSPRLSGQALEAFLRYPYNPRNIDMTENRLHYGVSNSGNIKSPLWNGRRAQISEKYNALLDAIQKHLDRPIETLHDVGCGVGFLIQDALARGLRATGNELNGYAHRVMTEDLGLEVWNCNVSEIEGRRDHYDVVVMDDYIEHTYHPYTDMKASHRLLKPEGILYLETFYIDSEPFKLHGDKWRMFTWPHVYHFSRATLQKMVEKAGFTVEDTITKPAKGVIRIFASK
jgi:2-polyprenyl-3-methyl-5-hydroxy-6-metoxy-1,4-benzoquinol methylase